MWNRYYFRFKTLFDYVMRYVSELLFPPSKQTYWPFFANISARRCCLRFYCSCFLHNCFFINFSGFFQHFSDCKVLRWSCRWPWNYFCDRRALHRTWTILYVSRNIENLYRSVFFRLTNTSCPWHRFCGAREKTFQSVLHFVLVFGSLPIHGI